MYNNKVAIYLVPSSLWLLAPIQGPIFGNVHTYTKEEEMMMMMMIMK